jgi:hypothetical protein
MNTKRETNMSTFTVEESIRRAGPDEQGRCYDEPCFRIVETYKGKRYTDPRGFDTREHAQAHLPQ